MKMRKQIVVFAAVGMMGLAMMNGCRQNGKDNETPTVTTASQVEALADPEAERVDLSGEKPVFTIDLGGSVSTHINEESPTLTVEAAAGGEISYQWYKNKVNANGGGTLIEGATEANYMPEADSEGITYYYAVATSKADKKLTKATSSTIEVQILAAGNWIQDDTGWWYKYADGSFPTAQWKKINEEWYYFDESGYIYANEWKQIGEDWYIFDENGKMLHDTVVDGYTVGSDGRWIP